MIWSHSRLETYEDCPRKFKYRYIDKIESASESIYAFTGNRVHQILEALYRSLHYGKIPELSDLLGEFAKKWESEKRMPLAVPENMTEKEFQTLGERCIKNYYARYHPFNQDTTLAVEEKITVSLQDAGGPIKIVGFVDRVSRGPDGTIGIHDYKTGKMKSQAGLDYDRQLPLYQIGLQQKWPEMRRFKLIWHYVAFNEEMQSERSPEQLEALKTSVSALVRRIESDSSFEPRKSGLCPHCEFQPICPLWKSLHDLKASPENEQSQLPSAQIVDLYGDLKNAKKIIETQIKDAEKRLEEHLTDEPKQALFGTRWRVSVSRSDGSPRRITLGKRSRDETRTSPEEDGHPPPNNG